MTNKLKRFAAMIFGTGLSFGCMSPTATLADGNPTGIAVVELFTSEGCSSCPPADAALADLIHDTKGKTGGGHVYALAFHVDYWDDLGWVDPFSQHAFTDRQNEYRKTLKLDGVYTPQAIVNGRTEFVGSDRAKLRRAVSNALNGPSTGVLTAKVIQSAAKANIDVTATGVAAGALIRVAVVQATATSEVLRGENGGRTLKHDNVVRSFGSATLDKDRHAAVSLTAPKDGWPKEASIIVYAQLPADARIVAATQVSLPG